MPAIRHECDLMQHQIVWRPRCRLQPLAMLQLLSNMSVRTTVRQHSTLQQTAWQKRALRLMGSAIVASAPGTGAGAASRTAGAARARWCAAAARAPPAPSAARCPLQTVTCRDQAASRMLSECAHLQQRAGGNSTLHQRLHTDLGWLFRGSSFFAWQFVFMSIACSANIHMEAPTGAL